MSMQTFYVIQPYVKQGRKIAQGNAFEVANEGQALRRIEHMISGSTVGVIAIAREHDPEAQEFGETRVIGYRGEVPPEALEE